MTAQELKEYILENNKIEYILQELGCRSIEFHPTKDYWTSTQPDINSDNKMGVVIKQNVSISYYSYSHNIHIEENKDIFDLVQTSKGLSFGNTMKYVHKILGLEYSFKKKVEITKEEKFDPLDIFKKVASKKHRVNVLDFNPLDEVILEDFVPIVHINWFREGIMPWTWKKFGLCYSYKYHRQCIPIRYWLDGSLMGMNQRTTIENYEELGIRKYYLTEGMNKSINVYGLWEHYHDIEKLKYCVVYEAERSVLKRDSLLDNSGLAIQGHTMSDEQQRIIKGLNIYEVIIAMDKDVPLVEVWNICEKFYHSKKVSYVYDKHDLLGEKDSPADAKNVIYDFLFKHRITYTEELHQKYLKSLEKK